MQIKCSKCSETKPAVEFHKNKNRPSGRAAWCKACMAANHKAKYQRSRPEIPEEGPGEKYCPKCQIVLAFDKFSKSSTARLGLSSWCKSCRSRRHAEKMQSDPGYVDKRKTAVARTKAKPDYREKRCEYNSRPEVKERNREYHRQYVKAHPEIREDRARWYRDNPEHVKEYREVNRDSRRASEALRRAAKANAEVEPFTPAEYQAHMETFLDCYWCGCEFDEFNPRRGDHVVPLRPSDGSAPGVHSLRNLVGACAACNQAKSNSWPFDVEDFTARSATIADRWRAEGIAYGDRYKRSEST